VKHGMKTRSPLWILISHCLTFENKYKKNIRRVRRVPKFIFYTFKRRKNLHKEINFIRTALEIIINTR